MAWSERLPSGRYRAVYRDHTGRKRTVKTPGSNRSRLFNHKAEAERVAAAKEGKARVSIWADPDGAQRTWGEWCTEWWATRLVAGGTNTVDESRRDTHLLPRWGTVSLGAIRRHEVKAWAAGLLTTMSPSTAQRCVHLLSASLVAAVDAELIEANPAARIQLPKGAQAQERFLTRTEYEAIADELPTLADRLVADTLVYTGLRWGEMAGLHRDRVHLDRGLFRIVETFSGKTGHIQAYPKGRRIRDVPVPDWLAEQLKELPEVGVSCGRPHETGRCRAGLMFTAARGGVLWEPKWAARWRDAVSRAGVGHVRVHDLRHTYASWLLQGGRPLAEVGKLMGHESTQTTAKYAWLERTSNDDVTAALGRPTNL